MQEVEEPITLSDNSREKKETKMYVLFTGESGNLE